MTKVDRVKGFKDFTGEEAFRREFIKNKIIEIFKIYGFEPAETPIIEYRDFVKGENENDEAVSDIFKLEDKGKRKLALRYELTFQLKRISKAKKLPYKRYSIGEVFRDEPVSKNRQREFTQCDIDIVGSEDRDESEILAIASRVLKELKINSTIYINNRELLDEILKNEGINLRYYEGVLREIDKLDKLSKEDIKNNLKKYNAEKILEIFEKPESYFKKYKSYSKIEKLKKYCESYKTKVIFLPSLVRGLSYYNEGIFEIKSNSMKETIVAGGSYLVNGFQSTGISFGINRLSELAKIKQDKTSYLVLSINEDEKAIEISENLRNSGKNCILSFAKISKALEYANYKKINKIIFVGKKELEKGKVKIRDMKTGKESFVSINKFFIFL